MRVLVCGGRDFADRINLFATLDAIHAENPILTLIEGGARGADELAAAWALERGVEHTRFTADWGVHGRAAGPLRNKRMIEEGKPDFVVAFPGGRGTANMTKQARAAGVRVVEPISRL